MAAVTSSTDLMSRITEKRAQLDAFISKMKPRKQRLVNLSIVAGLLAAALTVGPAAGGASFTGWLTKTFALSAPAWQILCAGAAVCSLTATASTQLLKSQNVEEHVTKALSVRAKLEVIEISLAAGQIDVPQATTEYIRCVEESSFL
ncbi:MAG TPA: hypothetical protein VFV95_20110 [Vicinamibacterales bacterium]|nr:hypothetical protein [Vicinamibacterales bacterium]